MSDIRNYLNIVSEGGMKNLMMEVEDAVAAMKMEGLEDDAVLQEINMTFGEEMARHAASFIEETEAEMGGDWSTYGMAEEVQSDEGDENNREADGYDDEGLEEEELSAMGDGPSHDGHDGSGTEPGDLRKMHGMSGTDPDAPRDLHDEDAEGVYEEELSTMGDGPSHDGHAGDGGEPGDKRKMHGMDGKDPDAAHDHHGKGGGDMDGVYEEDEIDEEIVIDEEEEVDEDWTRQFDETLERMKHLAGVRPVVEDDLNADDAQDISEEETVEEEVVEEADEELDEDTQMQNDMKKYFNRQTELRMDDKNEDGIADGMNARPQKGSHQDAKKEIAGAGPDDDGHGGDGGEPGDSRKMHSQGGGEPKSAGDLHKEGGGKPDGIYEEELSTMGDGPDNDGHGGDGGEPGDSREHPDAEGRGPSSGDDNISAGHGDMDGIYEDEDWTRQFDETVARMKHLAGIRVDEADQKDASASKGSGKDDDKETDSEKEEKKDATKKSADAGNPKKDKEGESKAEKKVAEAAKPDFLDVDKDGDEEESMKKALKDKEKKNESFKVKMAEAALRGDETFEHKGQSFKVRMNEERAKSLLG